MKGCNYIKELIDEAEKPDLLSFEVTEHIRRCGDCERFASERAALRALVALPVRVSAPVNFDAVLNARLAEVRARRSFSWLGSPGYLRLGAAATGLVVMIFAAQYAGLFSDNSKRSTPPQADPTDPSAVPQRPSPPTSLSLEATPAGPEVTATITGPKYRGGPAAPRVRRGDIAARGRLAPEDLLTSEDGGVVLVRGQNGDMDVQMPAVSVGAQPLLYVSAGRRAAHNVGTSF